MVNVTELFSPKIHFEKEKYKKMVIKGTTVIAIEPGEYNLSLITC